jgi:hypothetical protein
LKNRSSGPCGAVAAGRLAFPADPPWPFSSSRWKGLRGLCLGGPPQPVARLRAPSMAFASSSKPPSCPGLAPAVETTTAGMAASHGIRRYAPPSTCFRVRARQHCCCRDASGCHSRGHAARGFAPLQRITVPASRRRIAACCRSWGSPRFRATRLPPDMPAAALSFALPRDALRTPRRIPSPIAAPRHRGRCTSCGSTASAASLRPLAQPDRDLGTPPTRWALADRLLGRPPHTVIERAPGFEPRPASPTLAGRGTGPDSTGRAAASGPCSTDEFVPGALRNGYRNDTSTVLPGLRSPSRSSCPRPCGR